MLPKFRREQFENIASVILRVPGLFVIDYWWLRHKNTSIPETFEQSDVITAIITNLVLFQGILVLLLPLEKLVDLYMHYISAILITVAHVFSRYYVVNEEAAESTQERITFFQQVESNNPKLELDDVLKEDDILLSDFARRQVAALAFQILLATIISFLLDIHHSAQRSILTMYCLPVIARISTMPCQFLHVIHSFSSAFMMLQTVYYTMRYTPSLLEHIQIMYYRFVFSGRMLATDGIMVEFFNNVFVPIHFLTFWLSQLGAQLFQYMFIPGHPLTNEPWYIFLITGMSDVTNSPLSLIGACVTMSYVSHWILHLTLVYLQDCNRVFDQNIMHNGWTEGLTMILLSLQTGLIHLKMPQRSAVMSIILFIVASSLLQSMFEILDPVLLALSASRSKNISKHVRSLLLCVFLLVFPLYMSFILYRVFQIDFWILVVISSCVMTSVQVLGLLLNYSLFIYDGTRKESWENLDDIVYYARAFTRSLEFAVAVFVVGVGVKDSFTSEWSWINSSVLSIHCYFNVWQRLQAGWRSFLVRRDAAKKIESMAAASIDELENYDDVCAICYSEMIAAIVTPCGHLFHSACLKKCLYIQQRCPLCHKTVNHTKLE